MPSNYDEDLAYVHAQGFGGFAAGVAADLLTLLRDSPVSVRHVVDIGCGAGVTTRAFFDAGIRATGIEPSAAFLDLARAAAPSATFIQGSAYDVPLPPCEAVIAAGEALTYHDDPDMADDRVRTFLQATHDSLPVGGLLAFDVIETGTPDLSSKSWRSGEDWAVLTAITEDQAQRTLVRDIEVFRAHDGLYRRSRERHKVRLFDRKDLHRWLADAGFEATLGDTYGTYRLLPRRVAVVARRR